MDACLDIGSCRPCFRLRCCLSAERRTACAQACRDRSRACASAPDGNCCAARCSGDAACRAGQGRGDRKAHRPCLGDPGRIRADGAECRHRCRLERGAGRRHRHGRSQRADGAEGSRQGRRRQADLHRDDALPSRTRHGRARVSTGLQADPLGRPEEGHCRVRSRAGRYLRFTLSAQCRVAQGRHAPPRRHLVRQGIFARPRRRDSQDHGCRARTIPVATPSSSSMACCSRATTRCGRSLR